jgi:hypothetical protein
MKKRKSLNFLKNHLVPLKPLGFSFPSPLVFRKLLWHLFCCLQCDGWGVVWVGFWRAALALVTVVYGWGCWVSTAVGLSSANECGMKMMSATT